MARDLAAGAGDVPTAFEAIDRLVEVFPVEKLPERVAALHRAAPELESQASNLAVASIALDLSEQCVIEGDYERAECATHARRRQCRARQIEHDVRWVCARAPRRFDRSRRRTTWRTRTSFCSRKRPTIARRIGRREIRGVRQARLRHGLIMLSKIVGRRAGAAGGPGPGHAADRPSLQLKLADEWWNAAQASGEYRETMRRRAEFWYRKALPHLDGLGPRRRRTAARRARPAEAEGQATNPAPAGRDPLERPQLSRALGRTCRGKPRGACATKAAGTWSASRRATRKN
jgi:hypothetical protein